LVGDLERYWKKEKMEEQYKKEPSEDARIEPRTVGTLALTARRSNRSARSNPQSARSHPNLKGDSATRFSTSVFFMNQFPLSTLSEKGTSFYVLYSGGHKCNSL
jgi:hypothetical protein